MDTYMQCVTNMKTKSYVVYCIFSITLNDVESHISHKTQHMFSMTCSSANIWTIVNERKNY